MQFRSSSLHINTPSPPDGQVTYIPEDPGSEQSSRSPITDGMSLTFHIVFAAIGMALPLMMVSRSGAGELPKKEAYLLWHSGGQRSSHPGCIGRFPEQYYPSSLACCGRSSCGLQERSLECHFLSRDLLSSWRQSSSESISSVEQDSFLVPFSLRRDRAISGLLSAMFVTL